MPWLKFTRDDSDSQENRDRNARAASVRLRRIASAEPSADLEDPADVEARLRNLTHGTSSK